MIRPSRRHLETLELVGGHLATDFTNTVNARPISEHEYLNDYHAVLVWSQRLQTLRAPQLETLHARAIEHPEAAAAIVSQIHAFREQVYRILHTIATQPLPAECDTSVVLKVAGTALTSAQLDLRMDPSTLEWNDEQDLRLPLWPVALATLDLLRSPALNRLKVCPGCGWLFLDTTKNQKRRWCSMTMCGSTAKMRRYRTRALPVTER